MFNWFQALLPKKSDFFGMFEAHGATLVAAANSLTELVDGNSSREQPIREIDRLEHVADDIIREVLRSVRRTFLTPFDRSEIISLISALDDAVDEMQSTARAIDLYELDSYEPEMKQMANMIAEASKLIAEALPLLRNISKNGPRIHIITEKVVSLEGAADDVHAGGLKRAFQQLSNTPMQFIIAREVYKHLERITDALEDVANEIDGIVIDHA
jgi:predicted phosphate transport protein (TIGR00153 family)